MTNPVVPQKDAFFVHKRGQGTLKSGRNPSNDRSVNLGQKLPKTMEQLAREGAAQAMASNGSDDDDTSNLTFKNDTTAMSDLNSLQNFSYYGRRF